MFLSSTLCDCVTTVSVHGGWPRVTNTRPTVDDDDDDDVSHYSRYLHPTTLLLAHYIAAECLTAAFNDSAAFSVYCALHASVSSGPITVVSGTRDYSER